MKRLTANTSNVDEIVDDIPDGDWFKRGSRDDYVKLARKLLALGLSREEAGRFLSSAYWATAHCFGS